MQAPVLPQVLESALQFHPQAAWEAQCPTEPVDPATPANPMHCLATVANGSTATPAVVSPVALADASPKTLTYVSMLTAADMSPMTVAVQSHESRYQEPVLWQAQNLAFDTVDNPTLRCTHMVVLTTSRCYCEPFPANAVSK